MTGVDDAVDRTIGSLQQLVNTLGAAMSRLRGDAKITARNAMRALFKHFQNQHAEIARHFGISRQKVFYFERRGYVSAPLAMAAHALNVAGAKRENLRPDVVDWNYVEESALEMARSKNADAYPTL